MELEIYEALTAVSVPADKARAVAASIKKEINEHYAVHASQLATRGDLEATKAALSLDIAATRGDLDAVKAALSQEIASTRSDLEVTKATLSQDIAQLESRMLRSFNEMQRWMVVALFGAVGAIAALEKFLH